MRFFKLRTSVRIIVAGAVGVIFAITGFRGSAGPGSADGRSPVAGVLTAVAPAPDWTTTLDNWPWG